MVTYMNEILIDHEFKFHKGDIIVVGCSTGPDSMALMDMLLKIRLKYDLSLICAHVNHNIRKESYDEAIFMQEYCSHFFILHFLRQPQQLQAVRQDRR